MKAKSNLVKKALKTLGNYLEPKLAAKHPLPPALIEQATKAFEAASLKKRKKNKQSEPNQKLAIYAFGDQLAEVLGKLNDSWLKRQVESAVESFNLSSGSGWISPESFRAEVLDSFAASIQKCWPKIATFTAGGPAEAGDKDSTPVKDKLTEQRILQFIVPDRDPLPLAGISELRQRIAKILHEWVLVEIPAQPHVAKPTAKGQVRPRNQKKNASSKFSLN